MNHTRLREVAVRIVATGLDLVTDRIIEIGAIELVDRVRTGSEFHGYVRPGRAVSADLLRC